MVPGFEGIYQIKYLRRIKVVDRYYMTYDDYGHINPDPKAAALTHQIGPKSVITFPSGGQQLSGPGFYEISGLAWSGAGAIRGVEISTDGGAELEECRASVAGLSNGAYAIWLPLEMGRKRVHAHVALHGRTGHGSTDASRRCEILERTRGQSPDSRRRQYRSTVEGRQRRERSQWAFLDFSSLRRSSGFARLPGHSRPPTASGRTPSAEEMRAWDIAISPTGKELPPGQGTAKEGAVLYVRKGCAGCHGATGSPEPTLPR